MTHVDNQHQMMAGGGFGPPPGGGGPGGYAPPPGGGFGGPPPGAPPGAPGGFGAPPGAPGGYAPPPGPGGFGGPPQGAPMQPAYGPGPGYGPGPAAQLVPGVMKIRSAWMTILLMIVTCGIYGVIWFYQTQSEVRDTLNDQTINPGMDLLLSFVTCGIWGMVAQYKTLQKIHAALLPRQPGRKDQSGTFILFQLISSFTGGITGIIALINYHDELNALAQAAGPAQG